MNTSAPNIATPPKRSSRNATSPRPAAAPQNSQPSLSEKTGSNGAASQSPKLSEPLSGNGDRREVIFQLDQVSAQEVLLAGNFTDWDKAPIKLRKGGGGTWHTKVLLAPGRYHYKFLVDGEWRDDPNRTERCANPFGTQDCVIDLK